MSKNNVGIIFTESTDQRKYMTLDKLNPGSDAIIKSVNCSELLLRKHILDMGLTPGTEVTMIKAAPMGDPLEIRLRGYELTLRKADAAKIELDDIHDAHEFRRHRAKDLLAQTDPAHVDGHFLFQGGQAQQEHGK